MFLHAARQPILDREQNLFAYEVLFRKEHFFDETDSAIATSKLVAASQFKQALPELTTGKPGHVKFCIKSLLKHYPTMIPAGLLVIEVIDDAKPDFCLLKECKALSEAGYKILINITDPNSWSEFFPYIDMIKLDFSQVTETDLGKAREIKEKYHQIKLIANKVQTQAQFKLAKAAGFDYFQGSFFTQFQPLQKNSGDESNCNLAELLFEVSSLVLDIQKITDKVQADESSRSNFLCYNSTAIFNFKKKNKIIEQAVGSLSEEELIKVISILFNAQSNKSKPVELFTMSLMRAKFAKELAIAHSKNVGKNSSVNNSAGFLAGLFSLSNVMFDQPLELIVDKLKLTEEVSDALLNNQGVLALILELTKSYESADWQNIDCLSEKLRLSDKDIMQSYKKAVLWCNEQAGFIS